MIISHEILAGDTLIAATIVNAVVCIYVDLCYAVLPDLPSRPFAQPCRCVQWGVEHTPQHAAPTGYVADRAQSRPPIYTSSPRPQIEEI